MQFLVYVYRFMTDLFIFIKRKCTDMFYRIDWSRLVPSRKERAASEYAENSGTFRRGIFLTIIGLLHVVLGFLNTVFSIVRMSVIGFGEPFAFSRALGIYNITFEFLPLLLWLSGIGLLRAKRWGYILGSVWAVLAIVFHISSYCIRRYYWDDFALPFGFGEYIIIYYAVGFIAATIYMLKRKRI